MGLTSEQVHWGYGAALLVFGLLGLLRERNVLGGRWP